MAVTRLMIVSETNCERDTQCYTLSYTLSHIHTNTETETDSDTGTGTGAGREKRRGEERRGEERLLGSGQRSL